MPRALQICSTPGCPTPVPRGRCGDCRTRADRARGTPAQRGYDHTHRVAFRAGVLARDPLCRCASPGHGHGVECLAPSHHADHWPRDRRELVAAGLDPHDPAYGRGLCASCHSKHTSVAQPGGWNAAR